MILAALTLVTWAHDAEADDLATSAAVEQLCRFAEPAATTEHELGAMAAAHGVGIDLDDTQNSATLSALRHAYAARRTALLLDLYTLRMHPDAFTLRRGEPLTGTLVISADAPLPLFDLAAGVELIDSEILLRCDASAFAPDVAATTEAVLTAHAAGLVALDLKVQLVSTDDPSKNYCRRVPGSGQTVLIGETLRADLIHLGTDQKLCAFVSARDDERRVRLGDGGDPPEAVDACVEVTKIEHLDPGTDAEATDALDDETVSQLRNEVEAALLPCYQRALCRSGRRQGGLTVRASLDDAGRLRYPVVTVDALDSSSITGCALSRLEEVTVERHAQASADIGMVVIFKMGASVSPRVSRLLTAAGAARRSVIPGALGAVLVAPLR